jgi:hypothetical protein
VRYLREQVAQARGMPSKESIVRRLNFCQWVEAEAPWISGEAWFACEDKDFDVRRLLGRRCWGGLDLSSTQDLTALVLQFDRPRTTRTGGSWSGSGCRAMACTTRPTRTACRTSPGAMRGTADDRWPGDINKLAVSSRPLRSQRCTTCRPWLRRWRIEDVQMICDQEGSACRVPFVRASKRGAGRRDEYERRLLDRQVRHRGKPGHDLVCCQCLVVPDPAGNRKSTKESYRPRGWHRRLHHAPQDQA